MEKIIIDGNLINIQDFLSDTDKTYYAEPIKDGEIEGLRNIGMYVMRDKLKDILIEIFNTDFKGDYESGIEDMADRLIEHNVFVFPEKMKDSWELALPFMMRLFVADEAEIEKIKGEFEFSQKKKILADIRDYLLRGKSVFEKTTDFESVLFGAGVQVFIDKALADLTEYAEKLGVEL